MLTLIITILLTILFFYLQYKFLSDTDSIFFGMIGIIIFIIGLVCSLSIQGQITKTEVKYEQVVLVNDYYVNPEHKLITDSNKILTFTGCPTLTVNNVTNAPYVKIIKTYTKTTLWTFNHDTTTEYSIVFSKDE